MAGTTDVLSLAHFGGVGLKEVEASGAVTLGRDCIGETRGIGLPAKPAGKKPRAGEPRHLRVAQVGERQAGVNAGTPGRPPAEGVRMLPGWQQAVIRGAVNGLADQLQRRPRDAEAWLRLIRSRLSLGEEQAAREALARALATFSDDAMMRARIATDARLLGITQD
jgi:cytochrome c-type biogenesis protein CcmH